MEEKYEDEKEDPHEYDFLNGMSNSAAMDAMINKLYQEMPDLQSSCEQSQIDNSVTVVHDKSQQNISDDLCNYDV